MSERSDVETGERTANDQFEVPDRESDGLPNGGPASEPDPLLWHFPPAVTAIAMLVACGCAARALYGHPSAGLVIVVAVVGVAALCIALFTARMAFWVDRSGLYVRYIRETQFVGWDDVESIGLADVRGSETIRILRLNGNAIDVPPSLLQPVLPVTKPRLTARLKIFVNQITAQNPAAHN